jgi:hypothetical protein
MQIFKNNKRVVILKLLRNFFILIYSFLSLPILCYADVDFDKLYGSDTGMGIGARAISFGGAFASIADDPSAVYWNPAGLTDVKSVQLFLSGETPASFSAIALIISPDAALLKSIKLTFGLSKIRRLRFSGDSGNDNWNGYPSHLLDLAMIDIGENFSGTINSKTCDTRISAAFTPSGNDRLSIGINYKFLE